MVERFVIRALLVFVAGTIFGPLLFGCATAHPVKFVAMQPGQGVDLFVCAYPEYKPGDELLCVDWVNYHIRLNAQQQEPAAKADPHAL